MHFDTPPQLLSSTCFGKHTPSIRLAKGSTLTINRATLHILGCPQNILFWYSEQQNTFVLTAVKQSTALSFSIPAYCYNPRYHFQIRAKAFLLSVMHRAQWSDANIYVVHGRHIDQLGAIAFPLNNAMIEEGSLNV